MDSVIKMAGGRRDLCESILLSTLEVVEGKSVTELIAFFKIADPPIINSLSNYQARIWYTWKKTKIGDLINGLKDLEAKAHKAFDLRNEYRSATRKYMKDRKLAVYLEEVEKNLEWSEYLKSVLEKEKVHTLEDAYKYIIDKSKIGRDRVDELFKLK